jgi:hypothetical protein
MAMSRADLARFSQQIVGREVEAFSLPELRIIYVPFDSAGRPDALRLGHEINHLLFGHYHK